MSVSRETPKPKGNAFRRVANADPVKLARELKRIEEMINECRSLNFIALELRASRARIKKLIVSNGWKIRYIRPKHGQDMRDASRGAVVLKEVPEVRLSSAKPKPKSRFPRDMPCLGGCGKIKWVTWAGDRMCDYCKRR